MPTLEWSERDADIAIADVAQLDRALDLIGERCAAERPTIVKIRGNDYTITVGLGSSESFVQLSQADDEPRYVVTVGDPNADGEFVFYFQGEHHTAIPRRHLIPAAAARHVVREFVGTGRRSAAIRWEEM